MNQDKNLAVLENQISAEPPFEQNGWKFDARVTEQFDEMLSRSIPQYPVMREACFDVGSRFVRPQTEIVDLGASRGEAIAPFIESFGINNYYTLCEISEPMYEALQKRFDGWLKATEINKHLCRMMQICRIDLRHDFPKFYQSSLTLAVLTLQFIPIEHRFSMVQKIFDKTVSGGALIIVEKILGKNAHLDDIFVDIYLKRKRNNGYSDEEIQRKRLALEGVLVPMTAKANEEMLFDAGFERVECFWRWMNFAGWVAIKK